MSHRPVYNLVDVLSRLSLPADCANLDAVSGKWRCVIAPRITTEVEEEEEILRTLELEGSPVFLSRERANVAYDECGPDALKFVRDPRWNSFPKPQIAVRGGWGSPGTTLESSEYHKLIAAFDDVFDHKAAVEVALTEEEKRKEEEAKKAEEGEDAEGDSPLQLGGEGDDEVLEVQLFHRGDAESCPQLPPLGNALQWPCFLDGSASVVCDVDTVVSQRGARRWWRLNDCGELVMQAALPLSGVAKRAPPAGTSATASRIDTALFADKERAKPVKLLIFGPKGSYDWFVHDDESTVRGRIACLDLFNAPDETLPVDASVLPILTVAVLEAGGQPLLVPPNLPCTSVTLNDSVVVEQRRISHTLWLDEVSYFLCRTTQWASPPLIYEFVEKDLQDEHYVATDLIPGLMELFRRHDGRNPYEEGIRRRVAVSLFTIAVQSTHFHLSESSRASLLDHLRSNDELNEILRATTPSYCFLTPRETTLESAVRLYWDTKTWWPKAGCVLKAPLFASQTQRCTTDVNAAKEWLLPVVYCQFRPVFGTEKTCLEDTVEEYFTMKDLTKRRRELLNYLRTRKQVKDKLLDELF